MEKRRPKSYLSIDSNTIHPCGDQAANCKPTWKAKKSAKKTNGDRRRTPTFVTKIRTLFSCWSAKSSRYDPDHAEITMEPLSAADYESYQQDQWNTKADADCVTEEQKKCCCEPVARRFMQWLSGNEFDKLKDLVVTALQAVRDRDASQEIPDSMPEALTFICEYLTHVLTAMQFVTQLQENSGDDIISHKDLLNERGKCFVDLVMAVEKMHNRQIKMGKCTCNNGTSSDSVLAATPRADINDADEEDNSASNQNGCKRNRRRKRRGGRRN